MATISEALKVEVKANITGFKAAMGQMNKVGGDAIKKFSTKALGLVKVFAKIAAAGIAAFTGFAVVALKKAANIETAFANLAGLFKGESIESLQAYKDSINDLSREMGVNSVEMTNSFYQAVSAGFRDVEQASDIVRAASKAAIAGSVELPVAVEAITRVINAYEDMGYSASDATKVSDMLFQTVNYGVTTFAELAPQIGMVAGTAAKAKLPLEDMLGALATMTKAMPTAEAVTSLNALIMSFLKPTNDAVKAAAGYGIALNQMSLANGNFLTTLQDVSKLSATAFSEIFPNIRALRGVFSAASGEAKNLETNISMMGVAGGSTEDAFGKQWDTLSHAWKLLINNLNEAWAAFGEVFREDITDLLFWLNEKMPKLFSWIDEFGKWYEQLKADVLSGKFGETTKAIITGIIEEWKDKLESVDTQKILNDAVANVMEIMKDYALPIAIDVGEAIANAMIKAFKAIWENATLFDKDGFKADMLALLASLTGGAGGGAYMAQRLNKATGGIIHGPGGIDNVPANLTSGEYVVNAQATAQNRELLDSINYGNYHDVSTNNYNFGSRLDRRSIRDVVIPEITRAKRSGFGVHSLMARA